MGHMFLILIDAHSKWMEVYPTSSSSSQVTIEKMQQCFSFFGLPEQLVTDNGSAFVSDEFQQFSRNNGIQHIRTSPHHLSSNGQAERAVQTFKAGMSKIKDETVSEKVNRFLLTYRTTPHSITGQSPAELMLGRRVRTRLDLLKPDLAKHVHSQQEKQKSTYDLHSKPREFAPGTKIFLQNFGSGPSWLAGKVLQRRGPLLYLVRLEDGWYFRRHVDHLRIRTSPSGYRSTTGVDTSLPWPDVAPYPELNSDSSHPQPAVPPLRRSCRQSRPPERYGVVVGQQPKRGGV